MLKSSIPLVALILLTLSGCAPTKQEKESYHGVEDYFAGDYPRAVERLEEVAKKPDENFVLNNCRLGSAALAEYDLTTAEEAFLRAYEVINSVGVNDGGRSMGAALVNEKIKIWKGEPFERAMANFYLGLIYYMHQDYNNARGAFENALFKLRDYADKKDVKTDYRELESNFAVGMVMLGKTWQKLGREDLAKANFDRVRDLRPDLGTLCDYDRNAQSNLLLVVEMGYGPQKVRDADGSLVGFAPTPGQAGPIPGPFVQVDGHNQGLGDLDRAPIDLLAMAQDRRWQDIDTIRAVKSAVGTGLLVAGAGVTGYGAYKDRRDTALTGLALMGAGALLKASSIADVRQWETLPRAVFLLPLHVQPGTHDVTISTRPWGLQQSWRDIVVPKDGEATYYIRLQRTTNGEHTWPPPALAGTTLPAGN